MSLMLKACLCDELLTVEPAPMTEDLLEEQSEVLAKLGTSAEGAHLRARMQSACLLSDMESFKAANPGCTLEDFVRWYSPRDYVEEEVTDETGQTVVRGNLSARMNIPGNMWVEAWETAKATPARRQRRLFDDTKEAERVLHYLAVQKPADLTRHLLPCVLHAAVLKVKEEELVEDIPSVRKAIQQVTSHASKHLRHPSPDFKKLEDTINQLMVVETVIARARSLKAKFGLGKGEKGEDSEDLERFVSSLLEEPEVPVIGAGRGPAGSIIHKLFVSAQRRYELKAQPSPVLRKTQRSFRLVQARSGSFGLVRARSGSFGLVRARSGSLRVVRARSGSFGLVRARSGSFGLVRARSGSFGLVQARSGSFGLVQARSGSFRLVQALHNKKVLPDEGFPWKAVSEWSRYNHGFHQSNMQQAAARLQPTLGSVCVYLSCVWDSNEVSFLGSESEINGEKGREETERGNNGEEEKCQRCRQTAQILSLKFDQCAAGRVDSLGAELHGVSFCVWVADVNDWLKGVTEHVGVAKDHSVKEVAESAGVWKQRTDIRVYQQWIKSQSTGNSPRNCARASTKSGPPEQFSDPHHRSNGSYLPGGQKRSGSHFPTSIPYYPSLPDTKASDPAKQGPLSLLEKAALLAPLDDDPVRVGGPEERKPMGGGGGVPDFPPPAGREIVLRTCVPRPAPYSKALPQRLFCVLMREEFRLAGAFSSDTSFF
ncbi:hypothetical protein NFI96_023692 [Prochilodus magdalenae]|nr:hypothetical protein NFI96_023692 [Prochilodus magdalenae]